MNTGETHDQPGDVKPTPSLKVTPKRIATQMRRCDALILRGQGLTYHRIADDLSHSSASEARTQILTAFAGVVQEPVQELLTLQLEPYVFNDRREMPSGTSQNLTVRRATL
ncbi:hypothetical protein [Glaciihabitans sp. GrIS 2.15]|uniref:hypothetical protein n=1 Tax=Glaciihabitans sp. GrIS 2.15 TaxID=3071710 RepID=UPI002E0C5A6E|nr:hypothetical protein [Glaciihabitans sp. GrIS 2.15]